MHIVSILGYRVQKKRKAYCLHGHFENPCYSARTSYFIVISKIRCCNWYVLRLWKRLPDAHSPRQSYAVGVVLINATYIKTTWLVCHRLQTLPWRDCSFSHRVSNLSFCIFSESVSVIILARRFQKNGDCFMVFNNSIKWYVTVKSQGMHVYTAY